MTEATASDNNIDASELEKFNSLASRWWDPQGEFRPLHLINPVRLAYIEKRSGVTGRRCLDVGCGGGLLAEGLAGLGAASVLGIDLAPESLAVARLHAEGRELQNLSYRQISAAELAASQAGSFDLVTCLEVLEHVPKPGELIASLAQLLKPGGHLVLSTLNRHPKAFAVGILGAEYLLGILPRGTHRYERFLRPSELEAWARAAGLALRDLSGIHLDPWQGTCRLDDDVRVNYLAHFQAPGLAE